MNEKLWNALDAIHAEEELKTKTLTYLAEERKKREKPAGRMLRRTAAVLACLTLLLAGVGGWAYYTPTSAISVALPSALELEINRFDRVIGVRGVDAEGCILAEQLQLDHLPYTEALETILEHSESSPEEQVTIGVTGSSEAQCQAILQGAQACTAGENVVCYAADAEELEKARETGLPLGKYRVFAELQELDLTVTAADVEGLSMRELRDWLEQLRESAGGEETDGTASKTGNPEAGREGQGYRKQNGWGNGRAKN